jgi:flagellin-like hook-associated protein FlgL
MEAHPAAATIGDPIRLQLDIEMPAGYHVEIPKPVAKSGEFSILDFSSGLLPAPTDKAKGSTKSAPIRDGTMAHHKTQITIAVYRTGKFAFPAIPFRIKTADGRDIPAESPPVDIEIRSVLTEKNPNLKDLKKQAEIPEAVKWLLWISLIVSCGVLGALIWYFLRRRRTRPVALTPAQTRDLLDVAESDLRQLLARGLPKSGDEKAYYVALSGIVKKILEAGYGIHTAEQTTSEIMESTRNKTDLGTETSIRIESFLTRCDVVKFARYVPTSAEHETAAQSALEILDAARKAVSSRQSAVGSGEK